MATLIDLYAVQARFLTARGLTRIRAEVPPEMTAEMRADLATGALPEDLAINIRELLKSIGES